MGDVEASALRWTQSIVSWPCLVYHGAFISRPLIIETSDLTSPSTYWDTVLIIQGGYDAHQPRCMRHPSYSEVAMDSKRGEG